MQRTRSQVLARCLRSARGCGTCAAFPPALAAALRWRRAHAARCLRARACEQALSGWLYLGASDGAVYVYDSHSRALSGYALRVAEEGAEHGLAPRARGLPPLPLCAACA